MTRQRRRTAGLLLAAVLIAGAPSAAQAAWEPTKPIEFVVPAGTGGGADQMARLISGLAEKHKLSPKPLIVVNKSGGAGAEGFLHVKGKKGDAHTLVITLSNIFTTPLHTGIPFSWKELTPVARMALDEFILWVNAGRPDHHDPDRAGAPREVHLRAVQGRRGGLRQPRRQARGLHGQQPDRVREPLEGRPRPTAGCLRFRPHRRA